MDRLIKTIATAVSGSVAVSCAIGALADNLSRSAKSSAEARTLAKRGELDGAIGKLAGMHVVLCESIALYQVALALHCIRRRARRGTPHDRILSRKRRRAK